jgi:hypothetical protein
MPDAASKPARSNALLDPATGDPYRGHAWFEGARFSSDARFSRARFSGAAWFEPGTVRGVSVIGPLVCAKSMVLSDR